MVIILLSYVSGILLSNSEVKVTYFIIALLGCSLFILHKRNVKIEIIFCLILLFFGMIYPQLVLNHTESYIADKTKTNDIMTVVKVSDDDLIVKLDKKKYIIFNSFEYLPGDELKVIGSFSSFKSSKNPYVFKLDRYYIRKGISSSIYVEEIKKTGVSKNIYLNILRFSYKTRKKILDLFKEKFQDDVLGLVQGMFIGHTKELSDNTIKGFQKAGLTHIMAVSGANVAFILLPFRFMIFRVTKRKKTRIILLCFPTIFYLFLSGFGASIVRATIMVLIIFFIDFQNRQKETIKILSLSALIMLLISPFYIFDAGFLLSYAATTGIVLLDQKIERIKHIEKWPKILRKTFAISLSAQIVVAPVIILLFNKVSIVSLFANIVFVPFTEIITILSLICLLPVITHLITPILDMVIRVFLSGVKLTACIPFSQINFPDIPIITVIIYYLLVTEIIFSYSKSRRFINFLIAAMCISLLRINFRSQLEIDFLSANNGDSILISSKDVTMLIDGGDNRSRFGEYGLIPLLLKKGVTYIDMAVVTHSHADHMDGIIDVLDEIKVGNLFIPDIKDKINYDPVICKAQIKGTNVYYLAVNDIIQLDDDTMIEVFNPSTQEIYENTNNESIVMILDHLGYSVLFMGDAEYEVESKIYEMLPGVDILKAGHHGSNTSSSEEFLKKIRPKISVLSVGYNNYGHPSKKVIERLLKYGKVYNTKIDGFLEFIIKDDIIYLDKYIN